MENVLALVDAILIIAVSLVLGYLGNDRFKNLERRLDRFEDRTEQRFERVEQRLDAVQADITRLALTLVPPREAGQS
jgi:hypothetical protein